MFLKKSDNKKSAKLNRFPLICGICRNLCEQETKSSSHVTWTL